MCGKSDENTVSWKIFRIIQWLAVIVERYGTYVKIDQAGNAEPGYEFA